jgi:hypothetical protein
VSTDVGGVNEAVGEAGLLVPPRDPERFGEACLDLLRHDERRRGLGEAARLRAHANFTLDNFLGVYDEIYRDVSRSRSLSQDVIVLTDSRDTEAAPAQDAAAKARHGAMAEVGS